jgi:hypothetical protein
VVAIAIAVPCVVDAVQPRISGSDTTHQIIQMRRQGKYKNAYPVFFWYGKQEAFVFPKLVVFNMTRVIRFFIWPLQVPDGRYYLCQIEWLEATYCIACLIIINRTTATTGLEGCEGNYNKSHDGDDGVGRLQGTRADISRVKCWC